MSVEQHSQDFALLLLLDDAVDVELLHHTVDHPWKVAGLQVEDDHACEVSPSTCMYETSYELCNACGRGLPDSRQSLRLIKEWKERDDM